MNREKFPNCDLVYMEDGHLICLYDHKKNNSECVLNENDETKYGLIKISDIVLNEKYIKCEECKAITYNDDDNVCLACGSKKTLRLIK